VNLNKQQSVTPRDAARVFFRRWRVFAWTFCAIVAATVLTLILYPRSYGSEAKILIRVGRESVSLDPTATTGQTIMMQKAQDAEINSALDILNSASLHKLVAEQVGVDRILDEPPSEASAGQASPGQGPSILSHVSALLQKLGLSEPGTDLDLAIRRIQKGIRAAAGKNSTVISIQYTAASPELARDVVAAVIENFLEQHVRLNRTDGSLEFFVEQEAMSLAELSAAQIKLRDHKNKYGLASGSMQLAVFQEQIKNVELELLRTTRSLSYSFARIADLRSQIEDLKPEIVTNRVAGIANEAKDAMRDRLYELELKEGKLRARYTDEHPLVVEVAEEREAAQHILAQLPDERIQTTEALNPNQRKLELELAEERAMQEALIARKKSATEQHRSLNEKLRELNEQEVTLAALERSVSILEEKYRMHSGKLEQARVNDALERQQITNVNVVQPAMLVKKPVWPNKRLFAMLGMVLAMGGGLGVVILLEGLDQTLRTSRQVEQLLGLPVLLSLPRAKSRKGRRRRAPARALGSNRSSGAAGALAVRPRQLEAGSYAPLISQLVRTGERSGKSARFVGVVGCQGEESRSRVAVNLALRAAANGSRDVLLIDADARRRRVAKRFDLNGSPGFHEVLAGVAEAENCIHRPRDANLAVMGYGRTNGHAGDGPGGGDSAEQLDCLKKNFRLIVVDLPSTAALHPQSQAAGCIDEVVLVVEAEKTRIQSAKTILSRLERADVRVLGVVLANRRDVVPGWLYRRL
jgi:uncharacterized protein involved in exopolysaccharide biosynthesis/Mrp family chromosome partitioning ATPase